MMELDMNVFYDNYKKYFYKDKGESIVFEMGEDVDDDTERVNQVLQRFEQILDTLLKGKEVWVLLTIWDENKGTIKDLEKCGFFMSHADFYRRINDKENITNLNIDDTDGQYLLYYKNYDVNNLLFLASAIAGFELAMEESANVTAYILNFNETPIFINLYDDIGMEVISDNLNYIKTKTQKYKCYYQK